MTEKKRFMETLFGCDIESCKQKALAMFASEMADAQEQEDKKILNKFIQQNNDLQLVTVSCVRDEYSYLNAKYPGYEIEQQSLCYSPELDKHYDAIEIKLPSGQKVTINFDISSFY